MSWKSVAIVSVTLNLALAAWFVSRPQNATRLADSIAPIPQPSVTPPPASNTSTNSRPFHWS